MDNKRPFFDKKIMILVILICFAITGAVVFGNKLFNNASAEGISTRWAGPSSKDNRLEINNELFKVILNVRNMSCSGCITTIKESLAGFKGIKDIQVDIGSGRAEIYYDKNLLSDVTLIAEAITNAGYPADVLKIIAPDVLKKEKAQTKAKAEYYIASVGGWDISRNDFETELDSAKKKYSKIYGEIVFSNAKGKALLANLKYQIASRLIDEGIIMQEISKAGYKVDEETVEKEFRLHLEKTGKSLEEFKRDLNEVGYSLEYFKKKFETKVFMNKYINEKILGDASSPVDKQNMFSGWFNNSKILSEVVYYDKELENLIRDKSTSSSCSGQS